MAVLSNPAKYLSTEVTDVQHMLNRVDTCPFTHHTGTEASDYSVGVCPCLVWLLLVVELPHLNVIATRFLKCLHTVIKYNS